MEKSGRLYIAGHTGLFGSAMCREAHKRGFSNILTYTHGEVDLTRQKETERIFRDEKPDYVIMAAGLVGGIHANRDYMADFCMDNILMACNIISAAHKYHVKKLLYLGSSCIYPRECEQPIKEAQILTGACEPTNEGYALAKIAGIRLCEYYRTQYGDHFISCIPANVYGPNDCFEEGRSHVIPSLLMRFHGAKSKNLPYVTVWGSGNAKREFLYIEDAAQGCMQLMEDYDGIQPVNIGTGHTQTIAELARMIRTVVGYEGEIRFDTSKPDGMPGRLLDSTLAREYGIAPQTSLEEGLRKTYSWYLSSLNG